MAILRAQLGRTVPIRFTIRKIRTDGLNGNRQRINGMRITILNPDGSTLINAGTPIHVRTGELVYYWDTTGLASGDYWVQPRFGVGFDTTANGSAKKGENDILIRLVKIL